MNPQPDFHGTTKIICKKSNPNRNNNAARKNSSNLVRTINPKNIPQI